MTVHGAGANDSAYLIGTSALGSSARGVAAGHADRLISGDRAADHTKNCPVAGFSIGPKVRFTLSKHLSVAAGEVIFLVLAGFRGHSNGTYSVLVESADDYIVRVGPLSGEVFRTCSCSWSNLTERLSFTASAVVTGAIEIPIPKETMLALPAAWLVENSTSFLLGTNAALGPSVGQSCSNHPAWAPLGFPAFTFSDARAGGDTSVHLNFIVVTVGPILWFTLNLPSISRWTGEMKPKIDVEVFATDSWQVLGINDHSSFRQNCASSWRARVQSPCHH